MSRMRIDFPYLMQDRDRHGNVSMFGAMGARFASMRLWARQALPRPTARLWMRLEHPEGSQGRSGFRAASPGTLGWLAAQRLASVRPAGPQIAGHASPGYRGLRSRTAEAGFQVKSGRLSDRICDRRGGHDVNGSEGRQTGAANNGTKKPVLIT